MKNTSYITVNGLKTAYYDIGNKDDIPVIFIHGFPLDKSMWDGQLSHFANNYRSIAYDIRGFGESEPGDDNFSIELFTEDLKKFIDELSFDKVVLCGFSMGGYIALHAMEKFPEKVIGLALVDTQCQADTQEMQDKRMKSCENIRRSSLSLYADETLTNLLHIREQGEDSRDLIAIRTIIESTSKDVLCSALIAMANREAKCDILKHINIPALILVGEDDSITPPEKSEIMKSEMKGATLQVIPYAKHLSNIDNPEDFNRHLNTFLNHIQKRQSHLPHTSSAN